MRIAICDDNLQALLLYSDKIKAFAEKQGEIVSIQKYNTVKSLLFAFDETTEAADLLFLDINMPEADGITLAQRLRDKGYQKDIVFLTVSDNHMLPAFDVGAYNYLVKDNTTEERFERVVCKAIESAKRKAGVYMLFSAGGENRNVPVSDIIYFEMVNRILTVHYGAETFEFFSTLGKMENRLRNYGFIRIHRSILVAKAYIASFTYDEVTLRNGEKLPVSRGNYSALREAMEEI